MGGNEQGFNGRLFLIVSIIVAIAVSIVLIIIATREQKYRAFVLDNSAALKRIREINAKYSFFAVPNCDLAWSYDNENFYQDIRPRDYLIYRLVDMQSVVKTAIVQASKNEKLFELYQAEIKTIVWNEYDKEPLKNKEKLDKIEREFVQRSLKMPQTTFSIFVQLWLTNINGVRLSSKAARFGVAEIEELMRRLNEKKGDFYLNDDVWQALCRVERGKVSNKMRFAVYARDNHRCRKCGRATNDLEVDHIFPISKGGKSSFENLQTLCRRCNLQKSNTVEIGATTPPPRKRDKCLLCGASLVLRTSAYGEFYGCSNYPRCKFTKKVRR